MIRHLTSYWCIPALWNIIISVSVYYCVTDVYLCISSIYLCIFCYIPVYFCCILKKKMVSIFVAHHFRSQWRTISVAHLSDVCRSARRWVRHCHLIYLWRTYMCATDKSYLWPDIRGAPLVRHKAQEKCATDRGFPSSVNCIFRVRVVSSSPFGTSSACLL
jgi:hypothetical protein